MWSGLIYKKTEVFPQSKKLLKWGFDRERGGGGNQRRSQVTDHIPQGRNYSFRLQAIATSYTNLTNQLTMGDTPAGYEEEEVNSITSVPLLLIKILLSWSVSMSELFRFALGSHYCEPHSSTGGAVGCQMWKDWCLCGNCSDVLV